MLYIFWANRQRKRQDIVEVHSVWIYGKSVGIGFVSKCAANILQIASQKPEKLPVALRFGDESMTIRRLINKCMEINEIF